MMIVKEVTTKKELKKFVEFPNKLYVGNKYYCPPMAMDEVNNFIPKKNPAFEFCENKLFLAYEGKEIVGRIGAIISHKHIEKQGKKQIRFTRFDAYDDLNITRALFSEVVKWAKEKGMEEIIGPLGFTDIDREGMLVEGFDEYNLSITIYNHPYYARHLKALGFLKDVDWVEYQLMVPDKLDERYVKIAEHVKKRFGYKLVHFKSNKEITPYAYKFFKVINEAFDELYAEVALTDKIIDKCVKDYVPVVNKDYVLVVVDKEDNVIGFGLMVPSLAAACRKTMGHMFPFGWIHFLKALKSKKNDILEMYFIAVKPQFQATGVNAIIMVEAIKACQKNGVKMAETGPELETNNSVQDQWKEFSPRQHRRRRSWIIKIDDIKLN